MKKYYYILVFALSVFISACNQSPIEEGISKNIEKKQKEIHYSFDMNVGFGGGKLDDPSLINDLRSLSYNIDGRAWTIEGREELPEKDLNAIVYIRSAAGEGEILTAGTTIFKKVPGENKFYCDKITFPLEPNFNRIHDLKIENNIIKYKYHIDIRNYRQIKNKKLAHIYVNAILSYNPIEEEIRRDSDPYFNGTKYGYYRLSRYTIDNLKALYTKKNNEYNIDVPFIIENVKIEVKDGKLKVAEGEKPVMRPLGSLLFIKINNKTDTHIKFNIIDYVGLFAAYSSFQPNVEFLNSIQPRLSFETMMEAEKYTKRIRLSYNGSRIGKSSIDSIFGNRNNNIELKRGQSTRNYLLYFVPTEYAYGRKLGIDVANRKLGNYSWEHSIWEPNFPIANGTIYKANIDIDY